MRCFVILRADLWRHARSVPTCRFRKIARTNMQIFKVKVDYDRGKWVRNHPNPVVEVHAPGAREAAELACGMPLSESGNMHQYRAQVWPLGGVRYAHEIAHFYFA